MSDEHVWVQLFRGVAKRLADDGLTVECSFGLRTPMAQPGAAGLRARLCFVPGDDSGTSDAGKLVPTQSPGQLPTRALATFAEVFTVYVEAVDASTSAARSSDLAQYAACRTLWEAFWRAFHYSAYEEPSARVGGRFQLLKAQWLADRRVMPQGACVRLLIAVPIQFPDQPVDSLSSVAAELGGSVTQDPDVDGADVETQLIEADA